MNIVEPIRSLKDVSNLRKILSDNPRNELLFSLGINSGLRISDILVLLFLLLFLYFIYKQIKFYCSFNAVQNTDLI